MVGGYIMVDILLDAITSQLYSTFGNNYTYYVETVRQHLEKPCFTIDVLTASKRQKMVKYYDRAFPCVIQFFSGEDDFKKSGYAVAEQIVDALMVLPIQQKRVAGTNITWHFVENVLQVFVTYKFTTEDIETFENMEILDIEQTNIGG